MNYAWLRVVLSCVQLIPFATLVSNAAVTPAQAPPLLFLHYVGCAICLLGFLTFGVFLLADRPNGRGEKPWRDYVRVASGCVLCLAYMAVASRQSVPNLFFFVFLFGLGAVAGFGPGHLESLHFRSCLWAAVTYAACGLLDSFFVWTPRVSDLLIRVVSALQEGLGVRLHVLSFSAAGGWLLVCSVPAATALVLGTPCRRRLFAVVGFVPIIAAHVAQFIDPNPIRLSCLTFGGLVWAGLWHQPLGRCAGQARCWHALSWAGACATLGLGIALAHYVPAPVSTGGTIVLGPGVFARDVPTPESPEKPKGAALGYFLRFLERSGFALVTAEDSLTPALLREARALLICNLSRDLSADEIAAIDDYVRRGGSLVVFGDHH